MVLKYTFRKTTSGLWMENDAYLPVMSVWAEAGLRRRVSGWKKMNDWCKRKMISYFLPKSKPAIAPGHDSRHKLWHMWFLFLHSRPLLWKFGLLVFWFQVLRGKARGAGCGPKLINISQQERMFWLALSWCIYWMSLKQIFERKM